MMAAKNYFKGQSSESSIDLTEAELELMENIRNIWLAILRIEIEEATDFFESGGGSMDVVRLIEEIKDLIDLELQNEDVFMNTSFIEFVNCAIIKSRGDCNKKEIVYTACELFTNKMDIRFPTQLLINGEFVDSDNGKTLSIVNPTDETEICKVQSASVNDVDRAVKAATKAFEEGEWSKISSRERGQILFR